MDPVGSRSTRRLHSDSAADAAHPDEEARRVRPRTVLEDRPLGLSPRSPLPDAAAPQSPRRSLVSAEQLRQWRSSPGRSGPVQAGPSTSATHIAAVPASASPTRPAAAAAVPLGAHGVMSALRPQGRNDALRHVPPAGRNLLVVYALDQALSRKASSTQKNARSFFVHFGEALLQGPAPITLDAFLDHLHSTDPAQRSAAQARKLAYENEQPRPATMRYRLDACINALVAVPRERRMLTLAQALQRNIVGSSLQTLLPEADQPLLQRMRASEPKPDSDPAKAKQTALCRFGVALMARGHGGLAAWLQMRQQQPDGERLAEDLRTSIKDGPELNLALRGKRQFVTATGWLLKYGLGDGGAATADTQAETNAAIASTSLEAPPPSALDVTMADDEPGPSAAAASPTDTSWSIGSEFERLGGGEGLAALLQWDEGMSASSSARPLLPQPAASSAMPTPIDVTTVEAAASAGASASRAAAAAAGPSAAPDAMHALPPRARNTLVAHAAERALQETSSLNRDELRVYRSAFSRFGAALLEEQHITLDTFLDRLSSPEQAQRSGAAAFKAAYEHKQKATDSTRHCLNRCIDALDKVPREQRTFSLDEALRKMLSPALKTLLSDADLELLQKVQSFDATLSSSTAQRNQALLIRMGVASMARGHGGLAGWLQMHEQPDGPRMAGELLDRIKNDPELRLSKDSKKRLAIAAGRLPAASGMEVASTTPHAAAGPSAAVASPANASSSAAPQSADSRASDPLQGFAEFLESSLLSAGQATSASPEHEAMGDVPVLDPVAATTTDPASPDSMGDFAESLEHSLLSPAQAATTSPGHEAEDDSPLRDPGTPTADDLTFLGSMDLTSRVPPGLRKTS